MKALILAAGLGTRLRPLTDTRPKSMVEVHGTPILFKQLDNLYENNINDITVVVGYRADIVIDALKERYPQVKTIINERYDQTNNMFSAYMSKDEFYNTEFLLMNADVFFDATIITELLHNDYSNSIVVEQGVYNDESMKVIAINNRILEISKIILENEAYGVSVDVYKFSKTGSIHFFDKITEYIEQKKEVNLWTEVALNDILKEINFTPCLLKGRWIEIDNHEDLRKAESMF